MFDNGGVPKVHPQSRGIVIAVNAKPPRPTRSWPSTSTPSRWRPGSQGSVQMLEDGDVFIGWGAEPYVTEYAPTGTVLYNAHLPAKTESYRSYRFQWTGTPTDTPAVAVAAGGGWHMTVYASWNGATTVASWQVLAGQAPPAS